MSIVSVLLLAACSPAADEGAPSAEVKSPTPDQRAIIENLEALGYLGATELAPIEKLVTVFDKDRAYSGINLLYSGHRPEALLMDMDGKILHRWQREYEKAFPTNKRAARTPRDRRHWRRVHLFNNGDLLVLYDGVGIARLDKTSRVLWSIVGTFHHDFEVTGDGEIWTLKRDAYVDQRLHEEIPVLHDYVVVLDEEGLEEIRSIELYDAFIRSPYGEMMAELKSGVDNKQDIFHTNTLEILDDRMEHLSPAFRRGNIVLSMRTYSTVCVLDPTSETITWAQKGPWKRQHEPTALTNGNLLIFDNAGGSKKFGRSRVLEYDVLNSQIVWMYEGNAENPFYSGNCGANQRLPNGNTLITESNNGRALEVTPNNEVVWSYVSPFRSGKNGELIPKLFQVIRLDPDFPLGWMG
jgi:hypothetical protein